MGRCGKNFFLTLGLNKTCSELIVKGIYVILYTYDITLTDLVYTRENNAKTTYNKVWENIFFNAGIE